MVRILSLTTIQRDLLCQLLVTEQPISATALGDQLRLTPRQVQYGLREIKSWLSDQNLVLRHTPGVGIQILGDLAQKSTLLADLRGQVKLQLILTADQRQQLLALRLLTARDPAILNQFQYELAVSRVTVLKDLEVVETWLGPFGLVIARRQNRGWWVEGAELARRQALTALLWGGLPCERPVTQIGPGPHIAFALAGDAALLPIITTVNRLLQTFDLAAAQAEVAAVETELGGQFAEEAFAWLTLALAIQLQRVASGQSVTWDMERHRWVQGQPVWPFVLRLAARRWAALAPAEREAEAAVLATHLCAAPREELWRVALPADAALNALLAALMRQIAEHYALPELARDTLLRVGLEAHILPACVRQRFGLWTPSHLPEAQVEHDQAERGLIAGLSATMAAALGAALPLDAEYELVLLLRAALVRVRPERARRVLVVCPSGMATTQLLVARLRARLPRLGSYEVLPLRSLTPQRAAEVDLIISTVPLPNSDRLPVMVIQVHPSLRSEDIATLMQWMA